MIFTAERKHYVPLTSEHVSKVHAAKQTMLKTIREVAKDLIPDDPVAEAYLARSLFDAEQQYGPWTVNDAGKVELNKVMQESIERRVAESKNIVKHESSTRFLVED
jgi:hypothetical protein